MSEASLWDYIRNNAPGHWDRIEAPLTAVGHPDTIYTVNGVTGRIELKYSAGRKYEIRPSQISWFHRESSANGKCFILARFDYLARYRTFGLFHGSRVKELVENTSPKRWMEIADCIWQKQIIWDEFIWRLTNEWRPIQRE